MRSILLASLFVLSTAVNAQNFSERNGRYLLLHAGAGPVYTGFYGMSLEYGKNLLSGYVSVGSVPGLSPEPDIEIPGSVNAAVGMRFHMVNRLDFIRLRGGVQIGWLKNYYAKPIGTDEYDPVVYGGMVTFGGEYFTRMFSFESDISFQPGFAIFNPSAHPYFGGSLSISGGIGLNLFALRKKQIHNWDRAYQATQHSSCIQNFRKPWITHSRWCGKRMVYQDIEDGNTLLLVFDADSLGANTSCTKIDLSDSTDAFEVYMIEDFLEDMIVAFEGAPDYATLQKAFGAEKVWRATKGNCAIVYNREDHTQTFQKKKAKMTAQVTDIVFQLGTDKKATAKSKSLTLWNVKYHNVCDEADQ